MRIAPRDDNRIVLHSLDTGALLDWPDGLESLPVDGKLALLARVLRYFRPPGGVEVTTRLLPPLGSGLGASSTLFIALAHGLLAYHGETMDPMRIIRLCNNLEAQLMGTPAGMQDYFPPTFGGINVVHYDLEGIRVEQIDPDGKFLAELQRYVLVTNTNITHHSGTTNWQKMRNFFDGVPRTMESLRRIKQTVGSSIPPSLPRYPADRRVIQRGVGESQRACPTASPTRISSACCPPRAKQEHGPENSAAREGAAVCSPSCRRMLAPRCNRPCKLKTPAYWMCTWCSKACR